jgi:ornithine cyclodeaminase/alanine dehydrogenase-like protein (mu-crystallin family)
MIDADTTTHDSGQEAGAMDVPVLRLVADDLRRALEDIDPVELRIAQLTGPTAEHHDCRHGNGVTALPNDDLVLFEDPHTAARFVMPRSTLYLSRTTMMVALAASELLAAGETTVALLASGDTALFHLTVLARHLPGVGHVCLTSANDQAPPQLDERVLDLLGRAGIELSVVDTLDEAALGANLLITTGPGHDNLTHRHLTRGALLVNATGRDLPTDVINHVDQIYVDDIALLEHNKHRHFVTVHLAENENDDKSIHLLRTEGWHHPGATWYQLHRVETDIRQVISGHHPGRTHLDDVLLFELLGIRELDFALALRIHKTARQQGLGTWIQKPSP